MGREPLFTQPCTLCLVSLSPRDFLSFSYGTYFFSYLVPHPKPVMMIMLMMMIMVSQPRVISLFETNYMVQLSSASLMAHTYLYQCNKEPTLLFINKQAYRLSRTATPMSVFGTTFISFYMDQDHKITNDFHMERKSTTFIIDHFGSRSYREKKANFTDPKLQFKHYCITTIRI